MTTRFLTFLLCTGLLCTGFTGQANADTKIHFETEFAERVLEDVCSGKKIDTATLTSLPDVVSMVSHFAQFREYFTLEAYAVARQKAANCEKATRDIFRFNEVIDQREALAREVEEFKRVSAKITTEITDMVEPYTPSGLKYSGRATLMIGTPSCGGWSKGPDFYVDLPCISGDPNGLQYLIAHESYHGIQDMFMPKPDESDPIQRLLSEVLREGSATAIADFSKISGGQYTTRSQESLSRNERRLGDNFALLELAVGYLRTHPEAESYASVNNIGLSGQFDAPFYSVGAAIFEALENHDGRKALVCMLSQTPSNAFARYHDIASTSSEPAGFHNFGPDLASVITERAQKSEYRTCLPE